ncbi:hypothetical protein QFZ43_004877 [Streptomyces afghaniensis]|nr:hypothetical protein [Streptomyces afghaniensis]
MLLFGRRWSHHWEPTDSGLLSGDRSCDGRAAAGGFGTAVGRWVPGGVLNAGDEHAGGLAGGGQLTLGSGFNDELVGLVAAGFCVGEDGGERGPGGVGEDSLGVVGDGCSYVAGQNAAGFLPGWAGCEFGERRGEGVVGGCLEVLDGLAGGVGLVSVVLRLVPAPSDDGGPDEGCDQGGQGAAVGAGSRVHDVPCRAAQGVGGSVFCPDLGTLGSAEHLRGGLEFGAQIGGCLLGGGFEKFAEGGDVGLGVGVVGEVGVEGGLMQVRVTGSVTRPGGPVWS